MARKTKHMRKAQALYGAANAIASYAADLKTMARLMENGVDLDLVFVDASIDPVKEALDSIEDQSGLLLRAFALIERD